MTAHQAQTVRLRDGWHRWYGECTCGWGYCATGKFSAEQAVADHLGDNPDETPQPQCTCYDPVSMEYRPNHACDVCKEKVS